MRKNHKRLAVLASGALVLGSAGVAYAYWTTTGSGSDTAATSPGVTDTLTFDHADLQAMYPGDSAQDLIVTVTNAGPDQKVYVTNVKAYLTVAQADGAEGTCDSTDYLLKGAEAPGTELDAVALDWTPQELDVNEAQAATGKIQFNNKGTNQDACKGATVTVHYLAS